MKLPFSSSTEKQDQARLMRAKRNFRINQKERQVAIRREIVESIRSATTPRSGAYASLPGMEKYATSNPSPIKFSHWLERSVLELTHYKDLGEERQKAIDADVEYFNEVIKEQRKKHPAWNITIEYSVRDRNLPYRIHLTKK